MQSLDENSKSSIVTTKVKPSQYASSTGRLSDATMASRTMLQLLGVSRLMPILTYALLVGGHYECQVESVPYYSLP